MKSLAHDKASLMKGTIVLAALVLLSLISSALFAHHADTEPSDGTVGSFKAIEPPMQVPAIAMLKDGRQVMDMTAFKGKVVLLNLWATWCPPCIRELPALDRLQQRLGDDEFEVVAVAVDQAGYEAVRGFYQRFELKHLGLYLGRAENVGQSFPIDVFPASFFLDRDGRVVSYLRSLADWDAPAADKLVEHYKAR